MSGSRFERKIPSAALMGHPPTTTPFRSRDLPIFALTFVATLTVRVWGIGSHFWLLGDQMRDWAISLGSFSSLPLVGPATHVGGYTIGPAFYWILWTIRVIVGPWFGNLPHGGGIGQAAVESCADVLLLAAIWRRTGSVCAALAVVVMLATAPFALSLAAVVWNPVVGATLAKIATALVLLEWPRDSFLRTMVTAAVAWSAVHAYTGAIFVAAGVLASLAVGPLFRRDWLAFRRSAVAAATAVVCLQVPYAIHQLQSRFGDTAMGAVTGSVERILSGEESPRFAASATEFVAAVNAILLAPRPISWLAALLIVCGVVALWRHRRDSALLLVVLFPPALAVVGYAFFLSGLDHYYYLSLMPAAALTVVFAFFPLPPGAASNVVGIVALAAAVALAPARIRTASTMNRMPEYRALVDGSRTLLKRGQAMRAVQTDFALPPTGDPEFLYRTLGGVIDPASQWIGVIEATGSVHYDRAAP